MSRSGYSDDWDEDQWASIRWRGAVKAALRGKRGQAFLRELATAMDAMPVKELVSNELEADGQHCALGTVGHARGIDLAAIDPEDWGAVAKAFGIAETMAREIMYENDESVDNERRIHVEICGPMRRFERHDRTAFVPDETADRRRWQYMRNWVQQHITQGAPNE